MRERPPDQFRAGKRLWSEWEDEVLRQRYPDEPTEVLARELRRAVCAVFNRAQKLGLSKSAAYLESPAACRLRRGDNVGAKHRFPKGHVPANKGLRRPGWTRGRMRETQFKKGERQGVAAQNWRPVGTILTDTDGYQRIKVREAQPGEAYGFGNVRVWPLLNRHVWEQERGPIPPGHSVVFKDGHKANCAIENLELVSRADLMRRNSVHNYPPALKQTIRLLGALKRQIRKRTPDAEEQDRRPA